MKIASVNLRNSGARDGRNAWPARRPVMLATLAALRAEVIGFQEALADQQAELIAALDTYRSVGVGRDDGAGAGEYATLFFRRDRFELLDGSTFWLSERCDRPGRGWDAACTRICTWARVRDRSTGHDLLAANTHFDHVGRAAQLNSAALLRRKLTALAGGAAIVLTGDFNVTEDSPVYAELVRPGADDAWIDAFRAIHPERSGNEASCHQFTGRRDGSRIDWILHTPHLLPTSAGIDRTRSPAGLYPSDHYPVWATLAWRPPAP